MADGSLVRQLQLRGSPFPCTSDIRRHSLMVPSSAQRSEYAWRYAKICFNFSSSWLRSIEEKKWVDHVSLRQCSSPHIRKNQYHINYMETWIMCTLKSYDIYDILVNLPTTPTGYRNYRWLRDVSNVKSKTP